MMFEVAVGCGDFIEIPWFRLRNLGLNIVVKKIREKSSNVFSGLRWEDHME